MRTLEVESTRPLADALNSLMARVPEIEILGLQPGRIREMLEHYGSELQRFGVPNPLWLQEQGAEFHFFLINAQPGYLANLSKQTQDLKGSISWYILYGIWDSLVIFCGSEAEADRFSDVIQQTSFYDRTYFKGRSSLLYHRYRPTPPQNGDTVELEAVNSSILTYDEAEPELLEKLQDRKIILGPVWRPRSGRYPGVVAYTGVNLHGAGYEIDANELFASFGSQEALSSCLTHLWEVDRGYPYHYFARLNCRDLDELDRVTDELGALRIGRVSLEPTTFVVARGHHAMPIVRGANELYFGPFLDLRSMQDVATDAIGSLGEGAVEAFNSFSTSQKLLVLQVLAEVREQFEGKGWSAEIDVVLESAISDFSRHIFSRAEGATFVGPALQVITTVEERVRGFVRRAIYRTYGDDRKTAVEELRLTNAKLKKFEVSLGQLIVTMEAMRENPRFAAIHGGLSEDFMRRINVYKEFRDRYAHGNVGSADFVRQIHRTRRVFVEGMELLRNVALMDGLFEADKRPLEANIRLPPQTRGHLGIFVSHASDDKPVARRIARGLEALGYEVFFDEWSIEPGDSIVQMINDNLLRNDVLVALLSPASTASRWVQMELEAALMDGGVHIIPVVVEECAVPPLLKRVRYIRMVDDFETGFMSLLQTLQSLRKDQGTLVK